MSHAMRGSSLGCLARLVSINLLAMVQLLFLPLGQACRDGLWEGFFFGVNAIFLSLGFFFGLALSYKASLCQKL